VGGVRIVSLTTIDLILVVVRGSTILGEVVVVVVIVVVVILGKVIVGFCGIVRGFLKK
jgi:hypothetical protein